MESLKVPIYLYLSMLALYMLSSCVCPSVDTQQICPSVHYTFVLYRNDRTDRAGFGMTLYGFIPSILYYEEILASPKIPTKMI